MISLNLKINKIKIADIDRKLNEILVWLVVQVFFIHKMNVRSKPESSRSWFVSKFIEISCVCVQHEKTESRKNGG